MTNNFENEHETTEEYLDHDVTSEGHTGKTGAAGNLAQAWRTRPMFKFAVLLFAVFAVAVAGFSFFGGNSSNNDIAHLAKPPGMKADIGGALTPYMRQQTELANKERAQEALANNGSAMPTPVGQQSDVNGFGSTERKEDQLNELRAETEKLRTQVQQQQAQQQQMQQQRQAQEPFDNTLAEAMQRQMTQMLDSWTPKGIKTATVLRPEDIKAEQDRLAKEASASSSTVLASNTAENTKIIVNAGTVSYAQLLTEANSDVPGPILAQIVSGPLAGARAVGSFQVSQGYEKYLVLKFALADKKGKDYQINAVALDPDTTLGGMATEVDERYMVRVVLPAAAGFLQGMGQALSQGNSSIVTNGTETITTTASNGYKQGIYNGLGQAANTMGQFFQNQANLTKPLVRVAAGTPIGMFFVAPVTEPTNGSSVVQQQQNQNAPTGVTMGGYPQIGYPAGYPGTTVSGYGQNSSSGLPYPNYGTPSYGYSGTSVTNNSGMNSMNRYPTQYSPIQGYGQ